MPNLSSWESYLIRANVASLVRATHGLRQALEEWEREVELARQPGARHDLSESWAASAREWAIFAARAWRVVQELTESKEEERR